MKRINRGKNTQVISWWPETLFTLINDHVRQYYKNNRSEFLRIAALNQVKRDILEKIPPKTIDELLNDLQAQIEHDINHVEKHLETAAKTAETPETRR